jgi:hypothetical protein
MPFSKTWITGAAILGFAALFLSSIAQLNAQLPESALSVKTTKGKTIWWRSTAAPETWQGTHPAVSPTVHWEKIRPGLESSRLDLWGDRIGLHVAVILVRLNPAKFSMHLETTVNDVKPSWNIKSVPAGAAFAMNVGQFEGNRPWGWLVRDGREMQPPRPGPLSSALIIDTNGRAAILDAGELAEARKRNDILLAFQSYPAILTGAGNVPEPLRAPGRGVDLEHRDSRLALGMLPDGNLLFALTRFAGMGGPLSQLPYGPTTPEMAAIMGALGCHRAMLLDGGLSGQLLLRTLKGQTRQWPGLRSVPLGFLAFPK